MTTHILLVSCNDEKGLISRLSSVIFHNNLNIIIMREFVEEDTNIFFARLEFSGEFDVEKVTRELSFNLPLGARISINPKKKKDIVVLATKEHHCLGDLLVRNHFNELNANIRCVIANYPDLKDFTERFEVPFYHVSHEGKNKNDFEKEILEIANGYKPDFLVLAKFMRILTPEFVSHYNDRIINIHHSFLPAFVGAQPYRQAHERGVKLIGATAHIVNNNLDEGPIVTQKIVPVDHTYTVLNMVQAGREVERSVLAEALGLVFEDRVFVSGNKTIIFE